ncbi:MAG: translocation/assembly module TamB domain-containing protein, partial [Cruoricaptor ignavus]|nr:translocation/assembly module TamB domain-containing protein [Cruoricaptor ignavus]
KGSVAENTILYEASSKNENGNEQFLIAGLLKSVDDIMQISLNENGLKLDYNNWSVNPENKIQYSEKGLLIKDFEISHNDSRLALQSENDIPNSPLNILIKDFKISEITQMLKKENLLADGIISGNAQIRDLQKQMSYNADVKIDSLKIYENPIGNLHLLAKNTNPEIINTEITLSGLDNNAVLKGDYNTVSESLAMNLNLEKIQMKMLETFSQGYLKNTSGFINGNLAIGGKVEQPSILGEIKFNDVALQIDQIGSSFKNLNDEISFTNKGISFNQFKIYDPQEQVLNIDGEVLTDNYRDFAFNLDISGKDFNIVDSEKQSGQMLYGKLSLDTDLTVRGNMDLPKVRGNISITENTDFTFVMPQTSPTLQEREGIVEFISEKELALRKTLKTDSTSIENQSKITGMDVSVDISLNENAKMSVIIDEANGDFVKLQGDAQLTGGIDPSGKTTLVGIFTVHKGSYEMSIDLLRRTFDIQKGGTIVWTGEPTQADVNITAVYHTKAAPIDLLQQQLSGVTGSELNQYKQAIPFNTLLKINGELLKPILSFDITMNESNPSIPTSVITNTETKLAQLRTEESEMNKQVFALLLLNRFIGDNPFQSQTGVSAESMARQSVSRILSEQLNNLAGNLIAGVNLNFDLQSTDDYSTGERQNRTDLNVQLSKQLLNDRLKVSIGSNFGLEGEQRENEQTTNIAGDITIDYALSQDGRYTLRAYRKNEYQVALQGQVIETGVGFIITMDYNKFKEIFRKTKN